MDQPYFERKLDSNIPARGNIESFNVLISALFLPSPSPLFLYSKITMKG